MSSERSQRKAIARRAAVSAISAAWAYALFSLLPSYAPQLFGAAGVQMPAAIGLVLERALQLWPLAVVVSAASPLFRGTKFEGISSNVWSFSFFYILYVLLDGGTISVQSRETILGGASAIVDVHLWFSPLLWLTAIPIGARVLRNCVYTYRSFAGVAQTSAEPKWSAQGQA